MTRLGERPGPVKIVQEGRKPFTLNSVQPIFKKKYFKKKRRRSKKIGARNIYNPPVFPDDAVEIHTDAGCKMQYDSEVGALVHGTLCYYHFDPVVQEVSVTRVPSHRQYNSVFEFMAVCEAMKYAKSIGIQKLHLVTDSANCFYWFARINPTDKTKYHIDTFNEIQELKKSFDFVEIEWRPREVNKAGNHLEFEYHI